MSFAVATRALTRHFRSVRAVDALSLEVPRGVVFGFLGPNGSGKTTTIRLLLGLLDPTSGDAEVLGIPIARGDEIRSRAGALLEYNGLYERLTAWQNLEFQGRIYGMTAAQRERRIQELLEHMGLWDRRREPVGDWSRGMRQKLAVARAMLHGPDILFLDEPTAGLDPIAAAALREDLSSLVEAEGVTVFMSTHNLAEAEKLCALVGVIRNGRLLRVGDPAALRAHTGGQQVRVTGSGFGQEAVAALESEHGVLGVEVANGQLVVDVSDDLDTATITRVLVSQRADVREVRRGQASLEQVFLQLMEEEAE